MISAVNKGKDSFLSILNTNSSAVSNADQKRIDIMNILNKKGSSRLLKSNNNAKNGHIWGNDKKLVSSYRSKESDDFIKRISIN